MDMPEIHYAKSGNVRIAYQVTGGGPLDLVFVPGFISNLEAWWEEPEWAHLRLRLAAFSRLILFDKRGTGLSDAIAGIASLEDRMDDVRAVMDAVGSTRAALFGFSEGAAMSMLFAGLTRSGPRRSPSMAPLHRIRVLKQYRTMSLKRCCKKLTAVGAQGSAACEDSRPVRSETKMHYAHGRGGSAEAPAHPRRSH
jgi:pimeloyl-ACP methyl ester carboxylesterase